MSSGNNGVERVLGYIKVLVNSGGINKIHKGADVHGDVFALTGEIGSKLRGDLSGLSGKINKNLSGDATGITMRLGGFENGDVRQIAEEKRREKERDDTLSRFTPNWRAAR